MRIQKLDESAVRFSQLNETSTNISLKKKQLKYRGDNPEWYQDYIIHHIDGRSSTHVNDIENRKENLALIPKDHPFYREESSHIGEDIHKLIHLLAKYDYLLNKHIIEAYSEKGNHFYYATINQLVDELKKGVVELNDSGESDL